MAKKKSVLGKLVTLTTTVAAIGGVCYVFRDKIKESSVYHVAVNKLSSLTGKHNKYSDDDDFMFDDDFEEADNGREYTSITVASKETDGSESKDTGEEENGESEAEKTEVKKEEAAKEKTETAKEEPAKEKNQKTSNDEDSISVFGASIPSAFNTASADENAGLSNDDDDPDVLAEQDKLDF